MWQTMVLSFFAGVFGGNAVPHFVKGITKEPYPNLFGNSPVPNLIAGWLALVLTALLVHWARLESAPAGAFVTGALGVLAIGLFHAWHGAFGKKEPAQPPGTP
jgi:multisubunit Na+/H+ antiporter MnhB subunit